MRLAAPVDVACELALRILQALADRAARRPIDREVALDALEEQLGRGVLQARLLRSLAAAEGDAELVAWVDRWRRVRSCLAASASAEIRRIRAKPSARVHDHVCATT